MRKWAQWMPVKQIAQKVWQRRQKLLRDLRETET